jgi:hypothetical protein
MTAGEYISTLPPSLHTHTRPIQMQTMVNKPPPSYEDVVISVEPETKRVSNEEGTLVERVGMSNGEEVEQVGMTECEKSTNHFLIVYSLIMSALFFSYGLDSTLRTDKNFKYDPFGATMACGVINAISVAISVWRVAYNVSSKDASSFININGLAGLGIWIYMIIILDSSDGALLKADYAQVYSLMLAGVIISGTSISITLVLFCLVCCCKA